ncbi:DNA cytosine methyltransferase [Helicobacter pylori]
MGCYRFLEEGFECVATNEILEKRLNIQRINRKCKLDESYISGDIKKPETKEKILKQIGFYSKKFGNDMVDLVIATPPCQGMSVANHKKKNDEIKRNSLVVESIDLIKQIKPRFFILENVPSFYKTGCIDKNDNLLEIGSMIEQNLSGELLYYLCSNEGAFESDYLNPVQSSYQVLMRKDSPKLYNHQATNHSQAALEKLKLINKEQGKECLPKNLHGKQQFKSTWGRLNWNKISPTIDTRFDTPSNGTNSHPELHRSITPREAARIQNFSDNYIFYGNKTSVCKQIGNAVPPLLALALGKAILKSLRK